MGRLLLVPFFCTISQIGLARHESVVGEKNPHVTSVACDEGGDCEGEARESVARENLRPAALSSGGEETLTGVFTKGKMKGKGKGKGVRSGCTSTSDCPYNHMCIYGLGCVRRGR